MPMEQGSSTIVMLVAMAAIFYFLLIRPENKRKKAAQEMRNSLKKGERITTIGGIIGRVIVVNDESIVIETSEDRVRLEMAKWCVQTTESMEAARANKGKGGAKKIADTTQTSAAQGQNETSEADGAEENK